MCLTWYMHHCEISVLVAGWKSSRAKASQDFLLLIVMSISDEVLYVSRGINLQEKKEQNLK